MSGVGFLVGRPGSNRDRRPDYAAERPLGMATTDHRTAPPCKGPAPVLERNAKRGNDHGHYRSEQQQCAQT